MSIARAGLSSVGCAPGAERAKEGVLFDADMMAGCRRLGATLYQLR